jgi:hypothetical protein
MLPGVIQSPPSSSESDSSAPATEGATLPGRVAGAEPTPDAALDGSVDFGAATPGPGAAGTGPAVAGADAEAADAGVVCGGGALGHTGGAPDKRAAQFDLGATGEATAADAAEAAAGLVSEGPTSVPLSAGGDGLVGVESAAGAGAGSAGCGAASSSASTSSSRTARSEANGCVGGFDPGASACERRCSRAAQTPVHASRTHRCHAEVG